MAWRLSLPGLIGVGSAFPTGARPKVFYHTGHNVWCHWNATISAWLGPEIPIAEHNYLSAPPFSATTEALAGGLRNDLDLYVTAFTMSYYAGGGIDASNFWRVYIRYLSAAVSLTNIVYLQTTSNNWTNAGLKVPADMSNNPIPAGSIWVQTYLEKTLSPNPLYVQYAAWGRYKYT